MEQQLHDLFVHYGYLGIIIALVGGIVGLPLPDEVLLTFVGYNVYRGKMLYILALLSACTGTIIGITFSYFLGMKLGIPFLRKFGPKIHITEKKIERTHQLFEKFGPFLLFIGYFIPGIRHLTAYLAGISCLEVRKFCLYAYSGGIVWSFTFITLGKMMGEEWKKVAWSIHHYGMYVFIFILILLFLIFIYVKYRRKVKRCKSE